MTKPKTQKEETRWCIEYPDGYKNKDINYRTKKVAIEHFLTTRPKPCKKFEWKLFLIDGYKCVKIKIRRA